MLPFVECLLFWRLLTQSGHSSYDRTWRYVSWFRGGVHSTADSHIRSCTSKRSVGTQPLGCRSVFRGRLFDALSNHSNLRSDYRRSSLNLGTSSRGGYLVVRNPRGSCGRCARSSIAILEDGGSVGVRLLRLCCWTDFLACMEETVQPSGYKCSLRRKLCMSDRFWP